MDAFGDLGDLGLTRRPARRRPPSQRWTSVVSLAVFIGLWQLAIMVFRPNEILFPGPLAVVAELIEVARIGVLWPAFTDSMSALAIGLGMALIAGPVLGLLIGMSRYANLITGPYLWAYFATPDIAIAPLVILALGFGIGTKVWMIFFAATIPLMLACKDGVQSVDASLMRVARSFGASRANLFRSVIAPSTVPFIASGIRNAIARGFVGLLVVELLVGSGGLGSEVSRAQRQFNAARTFAFIIVLVIIALGLISLSRRVEAYGSRWREEVTL
jgi:ABC-type nitrate/sulfonate/bicarbonate transport system permease component